MAKIYAKNDKRVLRAWSSYDIANSVYNLIITTVLFPIYYEAVTTSSFNGAMVSFFGITIKNSVLYDYAIAAAYLVIVFLSPMLSGIADYSGYRKRFMKLFTTIGATSCFGLYWFTGENIEYGIILVGLAVIGFAGSLVFYNSFLPQIATPDLHNKISAQGFAWGYAGSVFLLLINILTIENFEALGFAEKLDALRISFLEVGVWWIAIAQIAFYYLHDFPTDNKKKINILSHGFNELRKTARSVAGKIVTRRFLWAFFFYSMGVQTIMLVAVLFGSQELQMESGKLIATIFILQFLGLIGAYLFAAIGNKFGNKRAIISMLIIWISVCIGAYFVHTEHQFYILAVFVGLVMGGIQSQSRSTYSKLIPQETRDTASYFSFYDVTEKLAIVLGMFSFGFIEHITGSMRNSALSLMFFFIVGLIFILKVRFPFADKS